MMCDDMVRDYIENVVGGGEGGGGEGGGGRGPLSTGTGRSSYLVSNRSMSPICYY